MQSRWSGIRSRSVSGNFPCIVRYASRAPCRLSICSCKTSPAASGTLHILSSSPAAEKTSIIEPTINAIARITEMAAVRQISNKGLGEPALQRLVAIWFALLFISIYGEGAQDRCRRTQNARPRIALHCGTLCSNRADHHTACQFQPQLHYYGCLSEC